MEASTIPQQSVSIPTDSNGAGWTTLDGVKPADVSVTQPPKGTVTVNDQDGNACLNVVNGPPNSTVQVNYEVSGAPAESDDTSPESEPSEDDKKLAELQDLLDHAVITQEQFNAAAARIKEGDSTEEAFKSSQAQVAATQSPGETQTVPEVRPQAAVSPAPGAGVSEASKRLDGAPAATLEDVQRANSQEAKDASIENSRMPNLVIGQRVQILEPNSEAGRMAYVQAIQFADGIQQMISQSGTPEARFAQVDSYVVKTRDGRSDILDIPGDQLKPLDDIAGWGRGQI